MNPRRAFRSLSVLGPFLLLVTSTAFARTEGTPSFRVGDAQFFVGGSIDLTGVARASNTGNSVATSFGSIPYENTIQGRLSEWRMSAQRSNLNLAVMDRFGRTTVAGYVEGDFAGNSASNLFVDTNAHTFRMTQCWVDVRHDSWEMLAGQAWSWVTPGLRGLGPQDPFLTRNLDLSLQVGLPWTRAAQLRAAYHVNDGLAMGVALENPEQFLGAGEVIFPFAFNAQLSTQVDANNNPGTPNLLPDVIGKVAWDGGTRDVAVHLEAVGLTRWFRITYLPIGGVTFDHDTEIGQSAGVTASVAAWDRLRVVATGFRGDGVGRYLGALGPDLVVSPTGGAGNFRAALSTVHGQSFLFGAEADLPGANGLAAYYGRVDFDRTAFLDTTNPVPNRIGGFGGLNSPNSANRTLHQLTIDASHTFWKSTAHGSLALLAQVSEVFRQPWFAATGAGAPNRALVDMAWLDVRYTLP